jgi:hypothetical protein
VTKVNSLDSALVYSTYLGGSGEDYGNAITLDEIGAQIYLAAAREALGKLEES